LDHQLCGSSALTKVCALHRAFLMSDCYSDNSQVSHFAFSYKFLSTQMTLYSFCQACFAVFSTLLLSECTQQQLFKPNYSRGLGTGHCPLPAPQLQNTSDARPRPTLLVCRESTQLQIGADLSSPLARSTVLTALCVTH